MIGIFLTTPGVLSFVIIFMIYLCVRFVCDSLEHEK